MLVSLPLFLRDCVGREQLTKTELDDNTLESASNLPHQTLDLATETVLVAASVALPNLALGQGSGGLGQRIRDALELGSKLLSSGRLGVRIRAAWHCSSGLVCEGNEVSVQGASRVWTAGGEAY